MKLTEAKYTCERGTTTDTYQSFTLAIDATNRITVDLDNLTSRRSISEYVDYIRWVADELEQFKKVSK